MRLFLFATMISSYPDALKYLYDNLPMFQRVGAAAIKKDLANTIKLCDVLGNPHTAFRSVHVAGTNGKGSTCHMLASVFQAAGYKTGLYTSPHLKAFTERIKIDGHEVSPHFVLDFVNRMRPFIDDVRPSFFEITVCMAFDYFAREHTDVAIIEVGLGGRLDSTNVITPLVSVITNIGWDHMDMLGNTLAEIAGEKAGIIKAGVPVVVSERQPEVEGVFLRVAAEKKAPLYFSSDRYRVMEGSDARKLSIAKENDVVVENLDLPLRGNYQHRNLPGVMQAIELLGSHFSLSDAHIRRGLERVTAATGLKGRWHKLSDSPTVICDTAHNTEGIRLVVEQLSAEGYARLFVVLGMVRDKDVHKILALLPKDATYFFCQAKIPRALDAQTLMQEAAVHGLKGEVVSDVNEARRAALRVAQPDDVVFIGGSTYVVAEIDDI